VTRVGVASEGVKDDLRVNTHTINLSETRVVVDGDNGEQSQDEFHETSDAPASVARVSDRARD
jgi:hypothetical protein